MPENPRLDRRAAGILLHPTSLPGPFSCGDLGPAAHQFIDALSRAGMRWWQMLPVTPIGAGNSPYSSTSAFAGSPLLVSHGHLHRDGWLRRSEMPAARGPARSRVVYARAILESNTAHRTAYGRFREAGNATGKRNRGESDEFEHFCKVQKNWLDDYALYCALREANDDRPWFQWPPPERDRHPATLASARRALREAIRFHAFVQHRFFRDWQELRSHARRRNVALMGDMPIFVSHDSSDVWANPTLYQLRRDGRAKRISGCPPDSFSATGQLWGHPQYDWHAHQKSGFAWWIARFQTQFTQADAVRIDHFLGFNRVWSIPGEDKTAEHGAWVRSPGKELFAAVRKKLGQIEIVAEDLGATTLEALALRDECGFPGMRIMQNAWWDGARYDQPHNYPRKCVAYTGTHDNETLIGWFRGLPDRRGKDGLTVRERTLRYLGCPASEVSRAALRTLFASHADLVIVPMQDVLSLGNEARMNTPAIANGNWEWRLRQGAFGERQIAELRRLAEAYQRD